jgi:hypothetical protein
MYILTSQGGATGNGCCAGIEQCASGVRGVLGRAHPGVPDPTVCSLGPKRTRSAGDGKGRGRLLLELLAGCGE